MVERIAFQGQIGILTLYSKDKRNRFDINSLVRLQKLIAEAKDRNCDCLILTHEGPNFCTGGDLSSLSPVSRAKAENFARCVIDAAMAIYTAPFTVIAALEGAVEGGGLCLVESCDLVVASKEVTFSIPEALTGTPPMLSLAGAVHGLGNRKAMELALLSASVNAGQCPMINQVVPKGTAFARAMEWAETINAECAREIKSLKVRLDDGRWLRQLEKAAEILPEVLLKKESGRCCSRSF